MTMPNTPACASCRLPWSVNADKRLGPDGAVLHEACAEFLGYLEGQQLDASKASPAGTQNGRIHSLEIVAGIYRVPQIRDYAGRLDEVERRLKLPRTGGDTESRLASLEALYGERLHFPLALWRLAAMLPEPWKA